MPCLTSLINPLLKGFLGFNGPAPNNQCVGVEYIDHLVEEQPKSSRLNPEKFPGTCHHQKQQGHELEPLPWRDQEMPMHGRCGFEDNEAAGFFLIAR